MISASLGKNALKRIVRNKCHISSSKYLMFKGLLKALSTECKEIVVKDINNTFNMLVNDHKIIVKSPYSGNIETKKIHLKTSLKHLLLNRANYSKEINQYIKDVYKVISKIQLKAATEDSWKISYKNFITFIPWKYKYYELKNGNIYVYNVYPLGIYESILAETINLYETTEKTISLKNYEISVDDQKKISLQYRNFKWDFKFKKDIHKIYVSKNKEIIVLSFRKNKEEYFYITPELTVVAKMRELDIILDHKGGYISAFTMLTTFNDEINYNENLKVQGFLWMDYGVNDHGIGVYLGDEFKAEISGDVIHVLSNHRENKTDLILKLHRGTWEEGGIDYKIFERKMKFKITEKAMLPKKHLTLIEWIPKHLIPMELSFKGEIIEIVAFNPTGLSFIAKIKLPWKIVDASKVSVVTGRRLENVEFDYNIVYLPVSANETIRLRLRMASKHLSLSSHGL